MISCLVEMEWVTQMSTEIFMEEELALKDAKNECYA